MTEFVLKELLFPAALLQKYWNSSDIIIDLLQ